MSTISSNTLFHFTPTADSLISILTNEFQPRFCLEKFSLGENKYEMAIPMICFCDIPLSQMKNHVDTYGKYGIGMTKEWAKKNGLNPVLYLRDKSMLAENLLQILNTFRKEELKGIDHLNEAKSAYIKILRYLKPYVGDFSRSSKHLKEVIFYNEREWRYTPEWTNKLPAWLTKNDFDNPITKAQYNEKLKNERLTFEPDDISYIIVNEDKEIFPMINALKQIKEKYDSRTVEILNSRIVTCDQILNDF